ncbi:GDYXXLXY domain-containing protein [Algibacter aquimarinus]|uniref:GDYXXLXY protein n=1 Tax=Algibacter aquimarinus TaxID=1136748 RepID=A0ABP9H6E3_9FLAO
MKTTYTLIIFIVVALLQLFIPTQMILKQESILKNGVAYKFKTQPVDPSDPFKGKYINLNYENDTFKIKDTLWQTNEPIFVYLTNDSLGFAEVEAVSRNIIPNKNNYVKAKAGWYSNYSKKLSIKYSFTEYYMEETKAYDAEVVVRNRQRDSLPITTYAIVYIKNGEAVLSAVMVDGISIKNYVENED